MTNSISPMSPEEREEWLNKLANGTERDIVYKFLRGQEEHHGDIGNVRLGHLFKEARSETLDQIAYLAEIERRVREAGQHFDNVLQLAYSMSKGESITQENKDYITALVAMSKEEA